jgi:hypothetical protein
MELERVLLACGFHEEDAEIIIGEFLSGMVNVGEARGAPADQMMSEILTQSRWLKFSQKHLMTVLPRSRNQSVQQSILNCSNTNSATAKSQW